MAAALQMRMSIHETLALSSRSMKYQPLQLEKSMTTLSDFEGNSYIGLKRATGIKALRQDIRLQPGVLTNLRNCTFLIVVTMYNEAPNEVFDTLQGIIQNLKFFREHGVDPDQIGCIVICDGLKPFLETVHKAHRSMPGVVTYPNRSFFADYFDEEMIKNRFTDDILRKQLTTEFKETGSKQRDFCENLSAYFKQTLSTPEDPEPEVAHCFQQKVALEEASEELNLIWAIKQENKKKLNTHLWFFGGFCQYIQPKYVMLLDVGTRPHPDALFKLYECMKLDRNVAGCCGEIVPMNRRFTSMVEEAQIVEYKYAHFFDKALESVIGYITVLPGAFSAYRWKALKGNPLWKDYFKSLCHPELMNAYYSNIYLAEDRVLCLALVSTPNQQYTLKYVRSSIAETDVPDEFLKLLAQRRRWINGSWFALIDTLINRKRINKSGHSCYRKFWLWFLMVYYTLNVIFSWFMVGAFFLTIAIMTRKLTSIISDNTGLSDGFMYSVYSAFVLFYLILLIINFFLAIGVKPDKALGAYRWLTRLFAFYMLFIIGLTIAFGIADDYSQSWAPWLVVATIGSFLITPTLYGVIHKVFPYYLSFLLMTPTYVNIFITYAMCNIHDCSWGNRPGTLSQTELDRQVDFKAFRTKWVIVWVLSNAAFAYFLNIVDKASGSEENASAYGMSSYIYIYTITVFAVALLFIRFVFSMIFLVQSKFFTLGLPNDVLPLLVCTRKPLIIKMAEVSPHELPLLKVPIRGLDEVLKAILCPISHEIMEDPVQTPYGHYFDRVNIESWIKQSQSCPITRKVLRLEDLKPCPAMRLAVELYLRQRDVQS
jgi:chitin synthase